MEIWQTFEQRKKLLQQENLTPEQYEERIKEILKEIENGDTTK